MHRNNMLTKVGGIQSVNLEAVIPLSQGKSVNARMSEGKVFIQNANGSFSEVSDPQLKENLIDQILENTPAEIE